MLTAFWSGLGSEFAKQWAVRILTPAFLFWAGGFAAIWWSSHGSGVRSRGWAAELTVTAEQFERMPGLSHVLLVAGCLLLVAGSAIAAERLTLPLLRLLEGYWSRPRWLRDRLVAHRRRRHARWTRRLDDLNTRQRLGTLTVGEFMELRDLERASQPDVSQLRDLRARRNIGLDARMTADLGRARRFLREAPRHEGLGMPTRLGDILRATERRPADKYGLDAVVCWYALWLVLPDDARTELVQARSVLDRATRTWLWGALFVVWAPWTWWAVPIAVVVPALAYYGGVLGAAGLFGELTGSAFDLYRFRLYDALHLPRPTSPDEERRIGGPRVTNLLWGGLDEPGLTYVAPPTG
ncbi:hypothetical protein StrepF001_42230 [Streptomyces sp. F001]|uniref:hypothetical protein n=1 Tax=Streptomyces sp. F001 TaxID=1510026 RepID=UPI00101E3134|nr:hypothetical protein [Streptomyces sp. F001]RZB13796.1 hypothetical protein StrepF001_42230 [Streptomyces sp. F001]